MIYKHFISTYTMLEITRKDQDGVHWKPKNIMSDKLPTGLKRKAFNQCILIAMVYGKIDTTEMTKTASMQRSKEEKLLANEAGQK